MGSSDGNPAPKEASRGVPDQAPVSVEPVTDSGLRHDGDEIDSSTTLLNSVFDVAERSDLRLDFGREFAWRAY
jgi:hypothetical protein